MNEGDQDFAISNRVVYLISANHGARTISVVNWTCTKCSEENSFDGGEYSLFSVSKKVVFSRDILDIWLFLVAGQGQPFRKAYQTFLYMIRSRAHLDSNRKKSTSSIVTRTKTQDEEDSNHRDELNKYIHSNPFEILSDFIRRRSSNDILTEFIKTIRPPFGIPLSEFFKCYTCEEAPLHNGNSMPRVKGIVLDGTATGILGDLPNYVRYPVEELLSISSISNKHFIFNVPRDRINLKKLALAITKANNGDNSSHLSKEETTYLIACLSPVSFHEEVASRFGIKNSAKLLLRTWFDIQGSSIEDSYIRLRSPYKQQWQLPISRFILCYMTDSIPGTILTSPESVSIHARVTRVLRSISSPKSCLCFHSDSIEEVSFSLPCASCLSELRSILPIISRFSPSFSLLLVNFLHYINDITAILQSNNIATEHSHQEIISMRLALLHFTLATF